MPELAGSAATSPVRAGDVPVDRTQPYPSCDWLEAGLAFNRRSLHACLIVHHGRGFPKLCDYNGGEVPWDQVSAARRHIISSNQQGGHPDCAGCPNLVTRKWPEPTHDVRLVGVAQFVRCNIFCDYCFLQTQDPSSFKDGLDPYLVEPAIDALIRDGRLAPDVTFDWGGGEPTIYKEFDSLLTKVTNRGGTTWVHTNASRFPKPLAEGLPADRVGIICSVDAGFPGTYLDMKGMDYLERVWANLTRFIEAGCRVHLKYIVKDANCAPEELDAFIVRAAQIGAKSLIVDLDFNHPNPSPEVLAGVALLKRLAGLNGIQASFGATGAQVLPEFDEARRAFDGGGNNRKRHSLLSPVRLDPDQVFRLLEGFTLAELPAGAGGGPAGLEDSFRSDGLDGTRFSHAVRFVVHHNLVATLIVICIDPAAMVGTDRLQMLADGFALWTGSQVEVREIAGDAVYSGRAGGRTFWVALVRHSVLFGVLAENAPFADGVAKSILRQFC